MKWLLPILCLGTSVAVLADGQPEASTNGTPPSGISGPASGPTASPAATNDTAAAMGGPRVQFEETRHNFGTVEPQVLKATFRFSNVGDNTLEIQKVLPGCGCTVIPDYDKKVEPGKQGVIHAELNAFVGNLEKAITVASNDKKNPVVILTLMANVRMEVSVLPQQRVQFGGLRPDSVANTTLEIKSELPQPLVVSKVESSVPWLTVSVVSNLTNSATIEVATKPPFPAEINSARITVFTEYEKHREIVIPASIYVTPIITAMPKILLFYKAQAKNLSDIHVRVERKDGKDFRITGVNPDNPLLTSEIITNQPGKSYTVSVKYTPKDGQQTPDGKLEILTDEPTWPKVVLPVIFR